MRFLYKNENLPSRFISQKKIFLCNILCITKTKCFCSETLSFRNSTWRPFLWCWEMQKAGCINILEVKIESIDHQTIYIMMLNNIVKFRFVLEILYLQMYIPDGLNEWKSALLINTSIMRQELWQYWLHVDEIPLNVSSTHSTYSNIPSFPLQFIFHSWDKKYFLFFTCLIFDFFIFLNPKSPLQIYKYLFAIWLSTFPCLKPPLVQTET